METAKSKIFVGVTGFGKSWIMGNDIEEFFSDGFFPIIVDKKKDHEKMADYLGFKKFTVGHKAIDNLEVEDWKNLIKNTRESNSGLWITIKKGDPKIGDDDKVKLGNDIATAILSLDFPIYYGLEELRNFAPAQSNDKDFNAVKTIIVEGRSMDVVFGGTCQFPQQVHYKVFDSVPILFVFGLGKKDNKYSKLSISGKQRTDMKNWDKDDRLYLKIDQNAGTEEVKSSKDISRQTPHSG